jgi:pSer/pThr/pTyr-binding forkhead associated (FHA) protein
LNYGMSHNMRALVDVYSSNGTFVNLIKLQRNGEEHQLQHGDIISLVGPPEHG